MRQNAFYYLHMNSILLFFFVCRTDSNTCCSISSHANDESSLSCRIFGIILSWECTQCISGHYSQGVLYGAGATKLRDFDCDEVDYRDRNHELIKQMALQMFLLSWWQTLFSLRRGDASWAKHEHEKYEWPSSCVCVVSIFRDTVNVIHEEPSVIWHLDVWHLAFIVELLVADTTFPGPGEIMLLYFTVSN